MSAAIVAVPIVEVPIVGVRGGATVEELAVVLATLQRAGAPSSTALTPYDQWRRRRIAAIHPDRSQPPG